MDLDFEVYVSLRIAVYGIILLTFSSQSYPQLWEVQQESFSKYPVTKIKFFSESTGFILMGERDAKSEVWKSTNAAETLTKVYETDSYLFDVFLFDQRIIVAGEDRLLISDDGGGSFSEVHLNFQIKEARFINSSTGWIVTADQRLRKTTDGGSSWSGASSFQVWDIYFPNSAVGFYVSAENYGNIFTTTDGGASWETFYTGSSYGSPSFSISSDNQSMLYNINRSFYLFSSNGGETWTQNYYASNRVDSKYSINHNTIIDYRFNKKIYISIDFGDSWHQEINAVSSTYDNHWHYFVEMEVLDEVTFLTGGRNGSVYKTTDGGNSWRCLTVPSFFVESSFFLDSTTGWYAGENLLKTTNKGEDWVPVYTEQDFLSDVYFINDNIGFGITYPLSSAEQGDRAFLITNSGGEEWDTLHTFRSHFNTKIYFRDANNGYVIGKYDDGRNLFFQTNDRGNSWNYDNPQGVGGEDIQFIGNTGFIAGYPHGYKTTDGGAAWVENTALTGHGLSFIDESTGWIIASDIVYKTTDGAGTSAIVRSENICESFDYIKFFDQYSGFVRSACQNMIYRTTDGGANWSFIFSGTEGSTPPGNLNKLSGTDSILDSLFIPTFISINLGWVLDPAGGRILKYSDAVPVELLSFEANVDGNKVMLSWITATETNNKGFELFRKNNEEDWQLLSFIQGRGNSTEVNKYSYSDKINIPGNYHYKLVQIDYDGRRNEGKEIEINYITPLEFSLSENYPNPFNPSTTINYSIPVESKVKVTIYNILGKEISTVLNERRAAGSYNLNIDADKLGLSSGMYIYEIQAGDYRTSKKMIMMK